MRDTTRAEAQAEQQPAAPLRSTLTWGLGRRRSAAKFFDHVFKFGDVFKAPVDGGETNIGNGVERTQLVHDEFAEPVAADLALAAAKQLILDAGNRRLDRVRSHRALAQRELHTRDDLAAVEFRTAAILLDDRRQRQLDPLIRRETFVAGRAAAAPANRSAVFGYARVDDLRIGVAAEGAMHDSLAV